MDDRLDLFRLVVGQFKDHRVLRLDTQLKALLYQVLIRQKNLLVAYKSRLPCLINNSRLAITLTWRGQPVQECFTTEIDQDRWAIEKFVFAQVEHVVPHIIALLGNSAIIVLAALLTEQTH